MKCRWLVRLVCVGTLLGSLAGIPALAQDSNVPESPSVRPICAFRQLSFGVTYDVELAPVVAQLQGLGVFDPYIAVYFTEQGAPILLGEGASYQPLPQGLVLNVGDTGLTHYTVVQVEEADLQAFVEHLRQIGCSPVENTQP